ncbi:MAG: type II toxin-antitoxin system RelE/ParE family toxin [Thermoguttaceae bacterium]|jgi:plasmid stabilization system protein ParE
MVRVDWSKPALTDLREVYEFIARDSRRYARATVEKITGATAPLAQWPKVGEVIHLFPAYREIIVGNYRLIYREEEPSQRVLIIAVIHASRDLPSILEVRADKP